MDYYVYALIVNRSKYLLGCHYHNYVKYCLFASQVGAYGIFKNHLCQFCLNFFVQRFLLIISNVQNHTWHFFKKGNLETHWCAVTHSLDNTELLHPSRLAHGIKIGAKNITVIPAWCQHHTELHWLRKQDGTTVIFLAVLVLVP